MKQNRVLMVVGQRGSGKSVYLKRRLFEVPRLVCFDVNQEYSYLTQFDSLTKLAKAIDNEESFHYSYIPNDIERDLRLFCKLAMFRGRMTVGFDEAHIIAPLHSVAPDLIHMITRGRHREVNILFATQRLALVSKLMTSQANETVFFKLTEPRDILAASEWLGEDCEKLKTLRVGEHIKRRF